MASIDRISQPLADRVVQPDGAHSASLERSLARATNVMAYKYAGGFWNYTYPYTEVAPWISFSGTQVWTSFTVGTSGADSVTYQVPWFHCNNYSAIRATIVCGTPHTMVSFAVRLISDDLVSSVAQSTGEAARARPIMAGLHEHDFHWRIFAASLGRKMRYLSAISYLYSPTLPGDRRIAVQPQVYVTNTYGTHFQAGGVCKIYLRQLILHDVAEHSAGA